LLAGGGLAAFAAALVTGFPGAIADCAGMAQEKAAPPNLFARRYRPLATKKLNFAPETYFRCQAGATNDAPWPQGLLPPSE
jgi:hypothetical protein